jgi:GTP-binding protein HflX
VKQTLHEIGADDKPTLLVFNKIDAYTWVEKDEFDAMPLEKENFSLDDMKRTWMAKSNSPSVFISAKNRTNLDGLRDRLYQMARDLHVKRYPYDNLLF